jgi:hypothetical protein
MFYSTDTKQSPWFVVESDDKRAARLNCIAHLLSLVPYEEVSPPKLGDLPPRPLDQGYVRPPIEDQTHVPQLYR